MSGLLAHKAESGGQWTVAIKWCHLGKQLAKKTVFSVKEQNKDPLANVVV